MWEKFPAFPETDVFGLRGSLYKNGEIPIPSFFWDLLGQCLVGAISFIALVVVVFAFTGQWPPQYLIISASIGGAMSPAFWRLVRWAQGPTQQTSEDGKETQSF